MSYRYLYGQTNEGSSSKWRSTARPVIDGLMEHAAATARQVNVTDVDALATFDFAAFFATVDTARRDLDMGWYDLAGELWDQSAQLNAERDDHPLCGGAVSRLGARGETSCQYALYLLRWLGQAPEEFLTGPARDVGDVRLPDPGPDSRLRWDLAQLHAALNQERQRQGLTWAGLAGQIGCTPSRLTNLRTARMADMALTMRLTQWLRRPAADFVHPASSRHRAELL
jgi:hypothetical protein